MRKVGASVAVAALAAVISGWQPAAAFGLRIGPFHLGIPFYLPHHRRLYMRANGHDLARSESAPGVTSALLYPNLAMPAIFQNVFFPDYASPWPFGYEAVFSTAFAKVPASDDQRLCRPSLDANAIVTRIRTEVAPTADQMALLERLAGTLGASAGFLAKACPTEIPAQPTARLQLMESQIEELTMAIDIVRQPLQAFEQSLSDDQKAKFAAVAAAAPAAEKQNRSDDIAPPCGGSPSAIDWSIDQIDKSVQPTDAQRSDLADIKQAFGKAVDDLQAHCPTTVPPTAVARLDAIEARLDATWRSVLSIQVALANFETKLSDEQKKSFDEMNFAAAQ